MKLVILLFFICGSAHAVASLEIFSLDECIQKAQEQSLQSIQATLQETLSYEEYDELLSQRWPQLSIHGRLSKSSLAPDQLSDANRASVHLEQNINPFSSVWKTGEQKKAFAQAASLAKLETAQDVAYLVKKLYYKILESSETIDRLDQVEALLKKLLNSVIPKFTLRRAPPFDLVKVKTALSDLTRLKQLTQAQLKGTQSQLAQVMGMKADSSFQLKVIQSLPALSSLESSISGIEANPTLLTLGQNVVAAELGVSAAKLARMPELVVGLDYGYGGAIGQNLVTGWETAVGFRLPVFDFGLIQSQVNQRKAQALLNRNQLDQERQKVRSHLIEVHAHAEARHADLIRLKELLPDVSQTAQASIDRYRMAGAGILETTEAIHLWVETLLNEREAYYSYLNDIAQIHRDLGVAHE
jgi:outer membrane protein TolC